MLAVTATAAGAVGLQLLKALAVLAAILLAAWAFRRFAAPRLGLRPAAGRMRVVERLPLEPRRSLYLVEVDGVAHLIGVSEGSVRLLEPGADRPPARSITEGEPR